MSKNRSKNYQRNNKPKKATFDKEEFAAKQQGREGNYQDAFADQQKAKKYGRRGRNGGKNSIKPIMGGSNYDNDPNWNAPTAQILKDANSVNFSTKIGKAKALHNQGYNDTLVTKNYDMDGTATLWDPGIMCIELMPSYGMPKDPTAAINTSGSAIYSFTRHANSGARVYDYADEVMYIMAGTNVYQFYAWMCRVYGVLTDYQFWNQYVPDTLCQAMHVLKSDLVKNMADFRLYINEYAFRMQSIILPSGITFIDRKLSMYSDLYTDSETTRAQIYLFNPHGFYFWNEGTQAGPGYLEYQELPINMTYEQIMDYGNALLGPVIGSEDFNALMAGDILKAFGTDIFKVSPIAETYKVSPKYSKEILMEIENCKPIVKETFKPVQARLSHDPTINSGIVIEQVYFTQPNRSILNTSDTGGYNNVYDVAGYALQQNETILNYHGDEPSPEEITVMTNLTTLGTKPVGNIPSWVVDPGEGYILTEPRCVGTDIPVKGIMYTMGRQGSISTMNFSSYPTVAVPYIGTGTSTGTQMYTTVALNILYSFMNNMNTISSFDWHPILQPVMMALGSSTTQAAELYTMQAVVDLDNYTLIDEETLLKIHDAAVLGQMTCRNMGPTFNMR